MKPTFPGPLAGVTTLAMALLLSLPQGASAQDAPPLTYVNNQVFAFAKDHRGQLVGDGQCYALAAAAVEAAGGKPNSDLGPTGEDADYVWGKRITTITPSGGWPAAVKRGDIIQFRNVQLTKQVDTVKPDGSYYTNTANQTYTHHTAVVSAVRGNLIDVFQQNISGDQTVQPGTIWGKSSTATKTLADGVKTTTTYTLNDGTMWVYRPHK
jgi:surface antigen